MTAYTLAIESRAEKDIEALDERTRLRVISEIAKLETNPRPFGYAKLSVRTGYRIRVGDRRVLYTIDDRRGVVTIYRVLKREKAYRA